MIDRDVPQTYVMSLRLSPELVAEIEKRAKEKKWSKAQWIRMALHDAVNAAPDTAT